MVLKDRNKKLNSNVNIMLLCGVISYSNVMIAR